jgi:RNA polymerase sigma-70 factor (ECF subfamily)
MGAVERFYRTRGDALRAFVLARTGDLGAAEDICQETFLAALARGVPGEEPEDAARWIFAIARNKVLKWHRDKRGPRGGAPRVDGDTRDPSSGVPRAAEPHSSLEEREERARVRDAVSALEPELREVILLRYEAGLDYREIATRLAVPVSTIQGRLKRARHALRDALEDRRSA